MNELASLLARLKTATPRERTGLALVAVLITVALASSAFDWAMRAQEAAATAHNERVALAAIHERIGEPQFQEQVALATGKVWRWSIVDQSEGLARAQAQSSLEAIAAGAGLANVVVGVADEPATPAGGLGTISLTLRAQFDWSTYVALLQALEASEFSFSAVSVEVSGASTRTLSMRLIAPYIREAPQ